MKVFTDFNPNSTKIFFCIPKPPVGILKNIFEKVEKIDKTELFFVLSDVSER